MARANRTSANRRNAAKSTGPRSIAGKQRASKNSYRHGLSARIGANSQLDSRIERLARAIAGDARDPIRLEYARTAAQAEFDLARIRELKVALIQQAKNLKEVELAQAAEEGAIEATIANSESEREAMALCRAVPDLLSLDRYERRAAAQRVRAIRNLFARNEQ
jgi:hypothetical protein